ncbi:acyltransferase family protein [Leifsonia sp. Leaf264]|uniref:acyltransferase family protein n=1 Tax=Leifsonia sp. Leaf264 TaxID=1736314 RepID=UPI0006F99EDB|nr:acyltransferase family protein [Leifsonia sp. Leaf264]KQO99450.1 hypothetical protein ASF30_05790 [Leifsonia sp. Leaf264]
MTNCPLLLDEASPPRVREVVAASSTLRPEIQALRAAAVLSVVLFHLWPGRLPGGYVGVDVFFAISGFLITAHLARELRRTGRIDLPAFWARRVRRLLPVALLVLTLTAIAVYLVVPSPFWGQFLGEIAASAVYAENWVLAADAVDYLAADNLASPVQHYWSLSVEEQFYLVWPVLLLLSVLIGRLLARRRSGLSDGIGVDGILRVVLAVVLAISLAWSVIDTALDPASAYFVTTTRVWEFAAGGLLAMIAPVPFAGAAAVRTLVQWVGWAMIGSALVFFTAATPFPGVAALLPVAGTLAVIWAGDPRHPFSPGGLLARRPVQYLGGISYSLYLWHWPLIVVAPFALGGARTTPVNVGLLALAAALAAVSKPLVEDAALRRGAWVDRRPRFTFLLMGIGMAVVVAVASIGIAVSDAAEASSERLVQSLVDDGTPCLGAAALLSPAQPCVNADLDGTLVPAPAAVPDDTGGAYACYDQQPTADLSSSCTLGSTRADALRVALVGDSHAAMLIPGLRDRLDALDWRLDTYVGRGCVWGSVPVTQTDSPCHARVAAVQQRLEESAYDLVITTARRLVDVPAAGPDAASGSYAEAWDSLAPVGTRVVALADNPYVTDAAGACVVAAGTDVAAASSCSVPRDIALQWKDPLPDAVERAQGGAHLVDLTDAYCGPDTCAMVNGHVVTYRDLHHITATYSRTIAPYLVDDITRWLGTQRPSG